MPKGLSRFESGVGYERPSLVPDVSGRPDNVAGMSEPRLTGLNVINRDSGEVESFIAISPGEQEMPGYVEHVERGYEGTKWRTERVHATGEGSPS